MDCRAKKRALLVERLQVVIVDSAKGVYKVAKVPKIPDDTHPNCRCSISETWVEGKDDNLVGGKRSKALEKAVGVAIADKIIKKPRITRDVNVIQKRYDDAVSQYQEETGIDVITLMHEGNFVDTSKPYDDEKHILLNG